MIIINKKQILIAFGIIGVFLFTFAVTTLNVNKSSKNKIQAIETVALPVDSKVIIIDARARNTRRRSRRKQSEPQKQKAI